MRRADVACTDAGGGGCREAGGGGGGWVTLCRFDRRDEEVGCSVEAGGELVCSTGFFRFLDFDGAGIGVAGTADALGPDDGTAAAPDSTAAAGAVGLDEASWLAA